MRRHFMQQILDIGILKNIKIEFNLYNVLIKIIEIYTMENIIFNFNNLNLNQKSFHEMVLEQAAININNWIKRNSHHKFPKSLNGWYRLLGSQFDTVTVKVNPKILLDYNDDLNHIHYQLAELKEKIIRFINKRKNKILLINQKEKLFITINSFSRFKYKVNNIELFEILTKFKIINHNTFSVNCFSNSNKRKRNNMVDENIEDDNIDLEISTLNNVKKKKKTGID